MSQTMDNGMSHGLTTASTKSSPSREHGCILVVSDSSETITSIDDNLSDLGFDILVASDGERALSLFASRNIDFVLIDLDFVDMPGDRLVYSLRIRSGDNFIPIVILASIDEEELLSDCVSAGCDDFLFKPFTPIALKARISSLEQVRELKQLYKNSVNEQLVAKQILAFALSERNIQFEEIKLLSRSKAVFSGDLFLTARHPQGELHVLLADFTGHGLSAAIGALPVADIFSVMTEKGFKLEEILENINSKLHTLLPVSMFMACSVLKIDSDLKHARVWNGGMPDIYLRDNASGNIKKKIKSTHIPLGIKETTRDIYKLETIDLCSDDQFILYTDGLTDAENANGDMFGYQHLEQCLESNRSKESIFSHIVDAFNNHCGAINPADDVTLACIPCNSNLTQVNDDDITSNVQIASNCDDGWCWYMELSGSSLRNVNPVPIVMSEVGKISDQSVCKEKLSSILTVLYENAIEHGLLVPSNSHMVHADVCREWENEHEEIKDNSESYLRIGLRKVKHKGESALLVSVEDSGKGFDHKGLMNKLVNHSGNLKVTSEGIPLVYKLTDSLNYHGRGNHVEAIISEC